MKRAEIQQLAKVRVRRLSYASFRVFTQLLTIVAFSERVFARTVRRWISSTRWCPGIPMVLNRELFLVLSDRRSNATLD